MEHVARTLKVRNAYRLLMEKPQGNRPPGRPLRSGWIILKWMSEIQNGVVLAGLIWLRIETSGELL
jgi:hypothetical protein